MSGIVRNESSSGNLLREPTVIRIRFADSRPEPLPLMRLVGETFNVVGQRTSRSPYLWVGFGEP